MTLHEHDATSCPKIPNSSEPIQSSVNTRYTLLYMNSTHTGYAAYTGYAAHTFISELRFLLQFFLPRTKNTQEDIGIF